MMRAHPRWLPLLVLTLVAPAAARAGVPAPPDLHPSDHWLAPHEGSDLKKIFESVATGIRFEPYQGALRGAVGTAMAGRGNDVDQALLLARVLRQAGYRCRFVLGRLAPVNLSALVRGMYPPKVPTPGSLHGGRPYDPSVDPAFASLVRDHVWVEVDQGPGHRWLPLDPSFPRAEVGETYGMADRTVDALPADLYQTVILRWHVVLDGGDQVVAQVTRRVVDVALRPISLTTAGVPVYGGKGGKQATGGVQKLFGGALAATGVDQDADGGTPDGGAKVRKLGGVLLERGMTVAGRAVKVKGGFAVADKDGTWPTRSWLEVRLGVPDQKPIVVKRVLFDNERDGDKLSDLEGFRRATLTVLSGPVPRAAFDEQVADFRSAVDLGALRSEARALKAGGRAASRLARRLERAVGAADGHLVNLAEAETEDVLTEALARRLHAIPVYGTPRLRITTVSARETGPTAGKGAVGLDLRRDVVRFVPEPGQMQAVSRMLQRARGILASRVEGETLARLSGHPAVTTAALMVRALATHTPLKVLSDDGEGVSDVQGLDRFAAEEAQAEMDDGARLIIPAKAVALAGRKRQGWWRLDPATGAMVGVMDDGGHQAMTEYSLPNEYISENYAMGFALGAYEGTWSMAFNVSAALLMYGEITPEVVERLKEAAEWVLCSTNCNVKAGASGPSMKAKLGDECLSADVGMKKAEGAAESIEEQEAKKKKGFCEGYEAGFKCAAGAMLAALTGNWKEGAGGAEGDVMKVEFQLGCNKISASIGNLKGSGSKTETSAGQLEGPPGQKTSVGTHVFGSTDSKGAGQ